MYRYLVILPLLFICAACGTKTRTYSISSSQWELFGRLPFNTEYLLYADLNEIRQTKVGEEFLLSQLPQKKPSDAWLNEFEKKTGTGLKKGIKEIIIARTSEDESVFLVRFEKNYNKVKDYFRNSPDFKRTDNPNVYSVSGSPGEWIYFPGKNIMAVSNREDQFGLLKGSESRTLKDNDKFISVIKNIKEKDILWMAADKGAFAAGIFDRLAGKDSKLLSPEILSSINNFTVSADFRNGTELESVLGCSNAGNAYLLASAIEGAIAMNILSQKNYRLGKILDKMDVDREGELIRFHLELSGDELNDIQQLTKLDKPGKKSKGKLWQ